MIMMSSERKYMYCSMRNILTERKKKKESDDISIQQKYNMASVYCLPSETNYNTTVHEEKKKRMWGWMSCIVCSREKKKEK